MRDGQGRAETKAKPPGLVERWNILSDDAKVFCVEMRKKICRSLGDGRGGLIARINDTDAPANQKRKLVNTIRQPSDAEIEFRAFLNDLMGAGTPEVLFNGAVYAALTTTCWKR